MDRLWDVINLVITVGISALELWVNEPTDTRVTKSRLVVRPDVE